MEADVGCVKNARRTMDLYRIQPMSPQFFLFVGERGATPSTIMVC